MKTHSIIVLVNLSFASIAFGHGKPVIVTVDANNKLAISGGIYDSEGFADMLFADGTEEAALAPGPSESLLTQFPGYDVSDIPVDNGVYLEIIPRPVRGSSPVEQRLLWHWSKASESVAIAPHDETLSLISWRFLFPTTTIPQRGDDPIGPLKIEEPLATDIGFHQHLMYYMLDDSGPASLGAYGFFAKLSSPTFVTSDPFLIVLNNGLSESQMVTAAIEINAAANNLPGDFDLDGDVDGADFVVWQTNFPTLANADLTSGDADFDGDVDGADFAAWQENFPSESAGGSMPVPESGSFILASMGGVILWLVRAWRQAG